MVCAWFSVYIIYVGSSAIIKNDCIREKVNSEYVYGLLSLFLVLNWDFWGHMNYIFVRLATLFSKSPINVDHPF